MRMSVRGRNTWMRSAAGLAAALLIGAGSAAAAPGESGSPSATASGSNAVRVDFAAAAAAAATTSAPDQQAPAPPQPPPPEAPPPPPPPPAPPTFLQSIQVTGFVDTYYNWNFNQTSPEALRNFDVTHNSFSLNYAEVAVAKAPTEQSRAGFRMDFGAGDTANLVNAFEPGGTDFLKYVQQAYVSVLAGKALTIDFGKFVTPAGAEVIENKDNFNYSRGLLFALAIPYYHAGARIGYAFNDKVSFTGYLVNGWNDVKDNNKDKTVIGSLTVKPTAKTAIITNYIVGNEQADDADGSGARNLLDLVATYTATDKMSVLGNFDYGHDKIAGDGVDWYGAAFGLKFQVSPTFAFSPRYEVFKDADGFATGQTQTLQEITFTGEYKIPAGFIARFEFRNDFSDKKFFTNDNDVLKKTQPTFAIGLIYAFDSKQ